MFRGTVSMAVYCKTLQLLLWLE